QNNRPERLSSVDAPSEALPAVGVRTEPDIDQAFRQNYARIARVIARVIGNRSRAEELAVDAFLRWWRHTGARGDGAGAWLYRVSVRMAIDELRRQARRARSEQLLRGAEHAPETPEDVERAAETRRRVRAVLATLSRRDTGLLILRSEGLSYQET